MSPWALLCHNIAVLKYVSMYPARNGSHSLLQTPSHLGRRCRRFQCFSFAVDELALILWFSRLHSVSMLLGLLDVLWSPLRVTSDSLGREAFVAVVAWCRTPMVPWSSRSTERSTVRLCEKAIKTKSRRHTTPVHSSRQVSRCVQHKLTCMYGTGFHERFLSHVASGSLVHNPEADTSD